MYSFRDDHIHYGVIIDRVSANGRYHIYAGGHDYQHGELGKIHIDRDNGGKEVLSFWPSLMIRQSLITDAERRAWDHLPDYVKEEAVSVSDRSRAMYSNGTGYRSRCAKDAAKSYDKSYCDYLEASALEYAERFPDRAVYFMTRTLAEALAGNDGD